MKGQSDFGFLTIDCLGAFFSLMALGKNQSPHTSPHRHTVLDTLQTNYLLPFKLIMNPTTSSCAKEI